MINEESLKVVGYSVWNEHFLRPIYDTYGFARLPDTTTTLLTGKSAGDCLPSAALGGEIGRFGKVVLILLDGLGWSFMDSALKSGKYPFLERIAAIGVFSKLSTQFPSTTTAHITTLKYGQSVGQHGLYEWNVYEPALGEIIVPIGFKRTGDDVESLRTSDIDPALIYPTGSTYFEQLAEQGVASYVFESASFIHSTNSKMANRGATVVPFRTLPEGLVNLGETIVQAEGPAYFYLYHDGIDSVCHKWGPRSPQTLAEIDTTLTSLERILSPMLEGQRDLALLLTADHGHAAVDPAKTVYLNVELPAIAEWLKTDRRGNILKFAGSARDVFLHIKPEFLDKAQSQLKSLLAGKAGVYRTAELIEAGIFGSPISDRLRVRMADLAILSYEHESVWWYEKDVSEMKNRGSHGSLERSEAETFLGFHSFR
ncbi:MAG: alkaline phosphatase family protein [Candidatus Methylacidiphilales bacterium]